MRNVSRMNCPKNFIVATRCVFSGVVLTVSAVIAAPAQGQSFLQKLESAVRERLNDSPATVIPNRLPPAGSVSEELPAPAATAADAGQTRPNNSPLDNSLLQTTQSVLESPPTATVPAAGPVPPPVQDNTVLAAPPADRRIYLGLEAEEITSGGIGVNVSHVTTDSPAWKAGFKPGDRIMAVGGFAIANLENMVEQLSKSAPGQSVKFLIARDGRNIELVAVLMEAGLAERIAGAALPIGQVNKTVAGTPWLGVLVNDLSPAFRNQFGLTVFRGAAITTVAAGSPAAGVGLMAGDAITSIDGIPIETARELMGWLETARPGQTVDVTYQRGSITRSANLTLEVSPTSRPLRSAARPDSAARSTPSKPGSAVPPLPQPTEVSVQTATTANTPPPTNAAPSSAIIPNTIPTPGPAGSASAETAELQREIVSLRAQLDAANQRLESTQNRLKQILEGLGNN